MLIFLIRDILPIKKAAFYGSLKKYGLSIKYEV